MSNKNKNKNKYKYKYEIRNPDGTIERGEHVDKKFTPDWKTPCEICGEIPTLPLTGMCGPCTFGESETAGGNW